MSFEIILMFGLILMAITFAVSLSLIIPWGYQTNTLIFGPGRYRFTEFTKVGAPLNLHFWIIGTIFTQCYGHSKVLDEQFTVFANLYQRRHFFVKFGLDRGPARPTGDFSKWWILCSLIS